MVKWRSASVILCELKLPLSLKGKFYRMVIETSNFRALNVWSKKQYIQKMNMAKMRILKWVDGDILGNILRNECIRKKVEVSSIEDKYEKID